MAIDFPNSPTLNQTFSSSGRTWKYDGEKWVLSGGLNLDDLDDVVITSPVEQDIISYDGSDR